MRKKEHENSEFSTFLNIDYLYDILKNNKIQLFLLYKIDIGKKKRGGMMNNKNLQHTVETVYQNCDGKRIHRIVKQIARFHRIQASEGYRQAAFTAGQILGQLGVKHQIRTYPADLKKKCFTQTMFREWNCSEAWLELAAPWKECLANYTLEEMSLIQRSAAGDFSKEDIPVVYIPDEISPEEWTEDIRGKAIFVENGFERWTEKMIREQAAAIITVSMPEIRPVRVNVSEDAKLCRAHANLSFHHYTKESESRLRGFAVSPEAGRRLKEVCIEMQKEKKQPLVRFKIASEIKDGTLENVEAWIPGETQEEVLMTAHLCHPRSSVNDNASGAASAIEAMGVLQSLIDEGVLEKPRRTIRLLLIPEFTGTYAYLEERQKELSEIVAGFNMDMVAGKQGKDAGPLILVDTPDCAHAFSGDLGEAIFQALSRECAFGGDQVFVPMFSSVRVPFVFGSDHYILSDPTINIPTVALTQWPDKTYHTSADDEAHADEGMLQRAAAAAAAFCYIYAAMNLEYAQELLPVTSQRFFRRIDALRRSDCKEKSARAAYLKELAEETLRRYERLLAQEAGAAEEVFLEERKLYSRLLSEFEPWEAAGESKTGIPARTFRGPAAMRCILAEMDDAQKQQYRKFTEKYPLAMKCMDYIFYETDGTRTLEEISRRVRYQTDIECMEFLPEFYELFEKLGLVEWKVSPACQ